MEENEIWKPVAKYYKVSNTGKIRRAIWLNGAKRVGRSLGYTLQNGYRECIKTGRWSGPVTGSGALGVAVVFRGQAQNVPICLYNYDKKEQIRCGKTFAKSYLEQ